MRSGTTNDFYGNTRGAIDFQEVKGIRSVSVTDNVIDAPYAEEVRADFGLGEGALSSRGITLRDNKRDDEGRIHRQEPSRELCVQRPGCSWQIPETDDFSLYWFQGEEGGPDGTTHATGSRGRWRRTDRRHGVFAGRNAGSTTSRPVTCPSTYHLCD